MGRLVRLASKYGENKGLMSSQVITLDGLAQFTSNSSQAILLFSELMRQQNNGGMRGCR